MGQIVLLPVFFVVCYMISENPIFSWSQRTRQIELETIDLKSTDPMKFFNIWRDEAIGNPDNILPDAMTLATVQPNGSPAARTVLLRGIDDLGYKIYTDYRSPKGMQIASNGFGALVFVWQLRKQNGQTGNRQVRIEGWLERLTPQENRQYFYSEPILAQIRTAVQNQSRIVTDNRRFLLEESQRLLDRVNQDPNFRIPMPNTWGGYRMRPIMMEFYQGTRDAINERIHFRRLTADESLGNFGPGVYPGENGWVFMQVEP